MGFGGGGYSAPPAPTYTPEKPQVAKPVTEVATAARQAQKDKAAKAAGIQGAVLTSPVQGDTTSGSGTVYATSAGNHTYLGQ